MPSKQIPTVLRTAVVVIGAFVALVAVIVGTTAATLPACEACHSSAEWREQDSAHAHVEVSCTECHVRPGVASRVTFAYGEVFGMLVPVMPDRGRSAAAVDDDVCLGCHGHILTSVTESNGLRIAHATCAEGRACADCHSDTAHGESVSWPRVSQMDQCLECHSTDSAENNCDKCHAGKSLEARLNSGSWSATHGPNWESTHGMGDPDTCGACHESGFCAKCHGPGVPHGSDFLVQHSRLAARGVSQCETCHETTFCDGCHGVRMPHPATFTPLHGEVADNKGKETCLRCHDDSDCTTCHNTHVHPGGASEAAGGSR